MPAWSRAMAAGRDHPDRQSGRAAVPDSCGPPDRPLVARNRRGRMGGPVYSPMRSAITSICRPKNSALASITLLNWPESSKLTMPNS